MVVIISTHQAPVVLLQLVLVCLTSMTAECNPCEQTVSAEYKTICAKEPTVSAEHNNMTAPQPSSEAELLAKAGELKKVGIEEGDALSSFKADVARLASDHGLSPDVTTMLQCTADCHTLQDLAQRLDVKSFREAVAHGQPVEQVARLAYFVVALPLNVAKGPEAKRSRISKVSGPNAPKCP